MAQYAYRNIYLTTKPRGPEVIIIGPVLLAFKKKVLKTKCIAKFPCPFQNSQARSFSGSLREEKKVVFTWFTVNPQYYLMMAITKTSENFYIKSSN